jgi:hypothetical protein
MNKYMPYAIIGILIIVSAIVISGRLNSNPETTNTPTNENAVSDTGPSPVPVSQINMEDNSSVKAAIDAELNQIEKELNSIDDSNFDASGLSDDQLGL